MGDYTWIDEVTAATVTFIRGPGLREVGDALGFRWETECEKTFLDAQWANAETMTPVVQAAVLEGWLVLVEPNGFLAASPQTAALLSRGGSVVSVYWNVNRLMSFVAARDGMVVRRFDPLLFGSTAEGPPLPEEEGLVFGQVEPSALAAAVELTERLTGVPIERAWLLEGPRKTWRADEPIGP
jgi:hypothetical protein